MKTAKVVTLNYLESVKAQINMQIETHEQKLRELRRKIYALDESVKEVSESGGE